ncbi:hypothetical protein BGZ76_004878 [Entomortierella beljakovae]|nr:hypothetical protein BGZ76_004878 [Entomortierella beljakovae]
MTNLANLEQGEQGDVAVEALAKQLKDVSLELRDTKLNLDYVREDLESCQVDLEACQADLDSAKTSLKEKELELRNCKDALANSEQARLEANLDRGQEVFVVLRFQKPQPLPVGAFRLFTLQRKAADRTLDRFIADHPELDVVEELRFERSPRGQFVYQHMKDDKNAPIEFSRRNFILKDERTEDEMIAYITQVFHPHAQENTG